MRHFTHTPALLLTRRRLCASLPHTHSISRRYYHFKPEKCYWIVFIILRKFWIAFAGLIFRGNPTFQLAIVLLVLFWAYMMQVQNRPYMSSAERGNVIRDLAAKARRSITEPGLEGYRDFKQNIEIAQVVAAKQSRKAGSQRFQKIVAENPGAPAASDRSTDAMLQRAQLYFFVRVRVTAKRTKGRAAALPRPPLSFIWRTARGSFRLLCVSTTCPSHALLTLT